MSNGAIYSGTREVRTYADLAHGANVLLEKAKSDAQGSYYTTMGALLLTAFTFEAYLNHLGKETTKFWDEIESIRTMHKYTVLCRNLSIDPDYSRRPYQTLNQLFKFRNAIAHGKSTVIEETRKVPLGSDLMQFQPKAHWEEFCTIENAVRSKEDVSAIIHELHSAAGLGAFPFQHGAGSGTLSLNTTEG